MEKQAVLPHSIIATMTSSTPQPPPPSSFTTTTRTKSSSSYLQQQQKKAEEINLLLLEPEVDLWKLRELALTDGGLVNGMYVCLLHGGPDD